MADPISVTGLALAVMQVLTTLYEYGKSVKDAREDIKSLSQELFALKGVLDHLEAQHEISTISSDGSTTLQFDDEKFTNMLVSTNDVLQDLFKGLEEPKSKFGRAMQRLKWPLDKSTVAENIAVLDRIKTWFILVLMTDTSAITRDLYSEVGELTNALKLDLRLREQERISQAEEMLFHWLAPCNPDEYHLRACKTRHPGTGLWFVKGTFTNWMTSPSDQSQVLCLRGKSGTGKTTLFSHALDELVSYRQEHPEIAISYFYCTFDDSVTQKPIAILGSIAAQLSRSIPSLLRAIRLLFNKVTVSGHQKEIEILDLEAILIQHLSALPVLFILIDAVNESSSSSSVIHCLERLLQETHNLRIFITTTANATTLQDIDAKHVTVVEMQSRMLQEDIATFIEHKLATEHNLRSLGEKLKDDVRVAVATNADASFRWVQLSLDHLSAQRTGKAVRQALATLPETLQETYCQMLQIIPKSDACLARESLLWLSFSERPLRLAELCEAVVLEESDAYLEPESRLNDPQIILDICHGLVHLSKGSIILTHSSIKQFLTSDWIRSSSVAYFSLNPAEANRTIMRKCLTYLSFDVFNHGYQRLTKKTLLQHPLIYYAAHKWAVHGSNCAFDKSDLELIMNFLDTSKLPHQGNFGVWLRILLRYVNDAKIRQTQPLYYAASFGLYPVVKAILDRRGPNFLIDARGGRVASTALFIATFRGHYEIVKILLEAGADPNFRDVCGHTCFTYARRHKDSRLQELLRETPGELVPKFQRPFYNSIDTAYDSPTLSAQSNLQRVWEPETQTRSAFKGLLNQYPNKLGLETILSEIENSVYRALVNLNEMVHFLAPQPTGVGQLTPSRKVNMFHFAGVANVDVTQGFLRLQEILGVSVNIKAPTIHVHQEPKHRFSIKTAKVLCSNLAHTMLGSITEAVEIYYDPDITTTTIQADLDMVESWFLLEDEVDNPNTQSEWLLRVALSSEKMRELRLLVSEVATIIEETIGRDMAIIYGNEDASELIIRCRLKDVVEGNNDDEKHAQEKDVLLKCSDIFEKLTIRGVPGIQGAFITAENDRGFAVDCIGTAFSKVISIEAIDAKRTCSNSFIEIFQVLGIEATRSALQTELFNIINFECHGLKVNYRYLALLADLMTASGYLMTVSRNDIDRAETDTLVQSSPDKILEIVLDAAARADVDECPMMQFISQSIDD